MKIPPFVVSTARISWKWQWNQLMNGLAPKDSEGNYIRPQSDHLQAKVPKADELINRSKETFPKLIIGRSCPWAHRTWLVYQIRGLEETLKVLIVFADPKEGLWKLNPPWMGCSALIDLYKYCGSPPSHRATVPLIIDPIGGQDIKPRIIGNESSQLIEVLNQWPTNRHAIDLAPKKLKEEINQWQKLIHPQVNDGVYRCGFARTQSAYDKACKALFDALEIIDESLSQKGPWLCGEELTLADILLFPTMIRWEIIYSPLFSCSEKPLWSFRHIFEWRRRFLSIPSVQETCDSLAWREDYFGALFPLRPSNIIPAGPDLVKIVNHFAPDQP